MNYLLDTNILSETFKTNPNAKVIDWFNAIPSENLYVSVLVLGEIRKGIEKLPNSQKKIKLLTWLEHDLPSWFEDRILPIDRFVADRWGFLIANCTEKNLPAIDSLIAATALTYNLTLITRNVRDFEISGLQILNPFK